MNPPSSPLAGSIKSLTGSVGRSAGSSGTGGSSGAGGGGGSPRKVTGGGSGGGEDSLNRIPGSFHEFSDSESDGAFDDSGSSASHAHAARPPTSPGTSGGSDSGSKIRATVKVAKVSPSALQRIGAFISQTSRSLSRGLSRGDSLRAPPPPTKPPSPRKPAESNAPINTIAAAIAGTGAVATSPPSFPRQQVAPSSPRRPDLPAFASLADPQPAAAATATASTAPAPPASPGLASSLASSLNNLLVLGKSINGSGASKEGGIGDAAEKPQEEHAAAAVAEQEMEEEAGKISASAAALAAALGESFAFEAPRTPTPEERRVVEALAARMVFKTSSSSEYSSSSDLEPAAGVSGSFRLSGQPRRRLLLEGDVDKKGTEAYIKRTNRRRLYLFSDLLLVAEPPASPSDATEKITVKQVIDLSQAVVYDRGYADANCFELQAPARTYRFVADDEAQHAQWVRQLRSAVLGLMQDTDAANRLGWQHRLVRGTLFSAALEGDVGTIEAIVRFERRRAKESAGGSSDAQQAQRQGGGEEEEEEEEEEAVAELLAGKDEAGLQPVHYAAAEGQEDALLYLVDHGGDASPTSDTLDTPLHYAAAQGQDRAVVRLLQKGADAHARNFQDRTPLFEAVASCDVRGEKAQQIVALLHQSAGADLHAADASGYTPLHKAAAAAAAAADAIEDEAQEDRIAHTTAMVRLLLQLGASPRALVGGSSSSTGETMGSPAASARALGLNPLQLACGASDVPGPVGAEVIALLLAAGAPPNANVRGPRPLEALLTARFFESGDPGDSGGSSASSSSSVLSPSVGGGGALDESVAKERLVLRLPAALELIRCGARISTKRMAKQGVDAGIISQIQQTQAEWEAKVVSVANPISPDKGGSSAGASPLASPRSPTPPPVTTTMPGEVAVPVEREGWMVKEGDKAAAGSGGCPLCGTGFSLLFRRHHCRLCGSLACGNCSGKKLPIKTVNSQTATERACDVCFNLAFHKAGLIKQEEAVAAAAVQLAPAPTAQRKEQEAARRQAEERAHARDQAELGLLNPSGRTTATRAGSKGQLKPGQFPASGMSAHAVGAVNQTQSVMAENMKLMADRGEKLHRMAERTAQMQQNAMDFREAAKALAEREKNRKWWEF